MSNEYLKPEKYYRDLYDRLTIDQCRRLEDKKCFKDLPSLKDKNSGKAKIKREFSIKVVIPTILHFVKGERYRKKAETIRDWMRRDQTKDDLLTSAIPPKAECLICRSDLIPNFRNLHDGWPDKEDRILFMYDCPNGCLPRRAFFDNGEEWKPKPVLCPKCKTEMNRSHKKETNKITTTYACPECDYKEKDSLDLNRKSKLEKVDPNFESDRKKYCLSDEEGGKYVSWITNFRELMKRIKDREENKEAYKTVAKIKKLKINDLEKLLASQLKKNGYIKLKFNDPEIAKDVIVSFSVRDEKTEREEYDSRNQLRRLIKKTLENTNWRLMSEGINYRLGILTGRLRGYEREEDLLKLSKIST